MFLFHLLIHPIIDPIDPIFVSWSQNLLRKFDDMNYDLLISFIVPSPFMKIFFLCLTLQVRAVPLNADEELLGLERKMEQEDKYHSPVIVIFFI